MRVPDLKILWAESGSCCNICRCPLIEVRNTDGSKYIVGEMAHIKGEKPTAARYDANCPEDFRDFSPENRILLCPTCHDKIDNDEAQYTVEALLVLKDEHNKWRESMLRSSVSNVTFAELEVVIQYLIDVPVQDGDYKLITSDEKIKKNNLSDKVDKLIKLGLMQRKQINEYLNSNADPKFSDRLRGGFIKRYQELRATTELGDMLFYDLLAFASNNSNDFQVQAAALSVVAYFFEICDIFEKE